MSVEDLYIIILYIINIEFWRQRTDHYENWKGKSKKKQSHKEEEEEKIKNVVDYTGHLALQGYWRVREKDGLNGGQSGAVAGFLRVLRFPLPIFIPPISPKSPSPLIRSRYNRPVMVAVPKVPQHELKKKNGLNILVGPLFERDR
jgi:hypothetical protein